MYWTPGAPGWRALRSEGFKEMFYGESSDDLGVREVELKMTTVKAVQKMLDYIYAKPKADRDWSDSDLVEVFQLAFLAEKFKLPGLGREVRLMLIGL
jgi:hypothetical protein